MKNFIRKTYHLIKETCIQFFDDSPFVYSGAIAFFAIFSLPAVLVIIVVSTGLAFGESAVKGELAHQISSYVGEEAARQVQQLIENASKSGTGMLATLISIGTILFSATVVFGFVQKALNAIWEVKAKPERMFLRLLLNRLLSLALVLVLGIIMLMLLLIDASLVLFENFISGYLSGLTNYLMRVLTEGVLMLVTTIVFAVIFKYLPDVKIKWRDVGVGAFITAVLFAIGRYLISLYVAHNSITSTYGTAGALVIILLWIYYSSLILLFGAEFTQVYTVHQGRYIRPNDHAVKIAISEVELE